MRQIIRSETFVGWLGGLRDGLAVKRIEARVVRLATGNAGDSKPIGDGLSEMRIDHGPGYRVYYMQRGEIVVVLLCGGDKRTQDADIRAAKRIAAEWRD